MMMGSRVVRVLVVITAKQQEQEKVVRQPDSEGNKRDRSTKQLH